MPASHVPVPPEGGEAVAGPRAFCGEGPRFGISVTRLVLVPQRARFRGAMFESTGKRGADSAVDLCAVANLSIGGAVLGHFGPS